MRALLAIVGLLVALLAVAGCDPVTPPETDSGVRQVTAAVKTDSTGLTAEQKNVKGRLEEDNRPGAVKHLYVFAQGTGVCFYSTCRGKVTSGGKRLVPGSVNSCLNTNEAVANEGFPVHLNGRDATTGEVMNEDGTYGHSAEYIFWWDVDGRYFQLFQGMSTVIISDQPIPFTTPIVKLRPISG